MIHGCSEESGSGVAGGNRRTCRESGQEAAVRGERGEPRSQRGHAAQAGSPVTEQEPHSEAELTRERLAPGRGLGKD